MPRAPERGENTRRRAVAGNGCPIRDGVCESHGPSTVRDGILDGDDVDGIDGVRDSLAVDDDDHLGV